MRKHILGWVWVALLAVAPAVHAGTCRLEQVNAIDLKTEFAQGLVVLKDQTLVIGRQNNGDYLFFRPDGSTTAFALPTGHVTAIPAALRDGGVAVASWDGRIHILGPDAVKRGEILAAPGRYIRYLAELSDGTLVALAIRRGPGDDTIRGSVHFLAPDGTARAVADLGTERIGSPPVVLADDTVALKTGRSKVLFVRPDGTARFEGIFAGARNDWLFGLPDGTVMAGGDFVDSQKILFLDPKSGTAVSELSFPLTRGDIKQDILFFRPISSGLIAVGFTEYEQTPDGRWHYHERVELVHRDGTRLWEVRTKDTGFSVDWNVSEFPDGTLVHGVNQRILLLSEKGELLDSMAIPHFVDGEPVMLEGDRFAILAIDWGDNTGQPTSRTRQLGSRLYMMRRNCAR